MDELIDRVELLVALASMYYLYRKLENARSVLAIAEHLDPTNRSVKEFTIITLVELGEYDIALARITELEKHGVRLPQEIASVKMHVVAVLKAAAAA